MKNIIKNFIPVLLVITIIFSSAYVGLGEIDFSGLFVVNAKAVSSGTCGKNLTWTLDNEGTLTISGTGNTDDYSEDSDTIKIATNDIRLTKAVVQYEVAGHTIVIDEAVAPTCTTEGRTEGIHCSVCNEVIKVQEVVPATGHDYYYIADYSPTCTEDGFVIKCCRNCGHVYEFVVPATGHTDSGEWSYSKRPTCTADGLKCKYCMDCFQAIADTTVPAKGHNYSAKWTIDKKPTCKSYGSKSHHCSRCDSKSDVTKINPVPHKFGKWQTISSPSATSLGQQIRTCSVCESIEPRVVCAVPGLKSVENMANGVKFTWEKVKGAKTYKVYRKKGNGKWIQIGKNIKSNSYADKTAKSGTVYNYTVKAVTQFDYVSGFNTNGLAIKFIAKPTLKSTTTSKTGITLKWNKVTGAGGYVVYRKAGNGSFVKLTTVKGATKVSYVDKSANKGTTYTYKLKAYSGKTYSAYSNAKTIKDKY